MPGFRSSRATRPNADVRKVDPPAGSSIADQARALAGRQSVDGTLLLVGGVDLAHFRLRVAQSHVRRDLAPSFWSHVGILREESSSLWLYEVALDPPNGFQQMPKSNGIQRTTVSRYEDARRFPNVALLRFPVVPPPAGAVGQDAPPAPTIAEAIDSVRDERGVLDLPGLVLPWLGFVWGAGAPGNPLIGGVGVPSAVFAEAAFAALGVELTPGLSTRSSCPEAIWQAALWWREYYAGRGPRETSPDGRTQASGAYHPSGVYWLGQAEAAYLEAASSPHG
jgi:hypothetical protein